MFIKLTCFLLVASVLTGSGGIPTHYKDNVLEMLEEYVAEAINQVDVLFDHYVFENTEYIVKLETLLENDISTNFPKLDNTTVECIIKYSGEVRDIIQAAKQSITECLRAGASRFVQLVVKINKLRELLREKIQEAKEVVAQCVSENPGDNVAIFNCVEEKGKPIRDEIVALLQKLREELVNGEQELASIIADTKACVGGVVEAARDQIQAVVEKIKQCIAEGKQ